MQPELVLVAGPLVGVSGWRPTARKLRALDWQVHLPDVLTAAGGPTHAPRWSSWPSQLVALLSLSEPPIMVGHSIASLLVADLACKLPVRGVIIVDGEIPPDRGPTGPVTPEFRQRIEQRADRDGLLPPWSEWWRTERGAAILGTDVLARHPELYEEFQRGLPRMRLDWFDDVIELSPWSHVPAGYVQTSALYEHSADEAERRGWPVIRLRGTHLHPTLQPDETAEAIARLVAQIERRPP